jgi:hypothetical protein
MNGKERYTAAPQLIEERKTQDNLRGRETGYGSEIMRRELREAKWAGIT